MATDTENLEKLKKEIREDLEKIVRDPKIVDLILSEMNKPIWEELGERKMGWEGTKRDIYSTIAGSAGNIGSKEGYEVLRKYTALAETEYRKEQAAKTSISYKMATEAEKLKEEVTKDLTEIIKDERIVTAVLAKLDDSDNESNVSAWELYPSGTYASAAIFAGQYLNSPPELSARIEAFNELYLQKQRKAYAEERRNKL